MVEMALTVEMVEMDETGFKEQREKRGVKGTLETPGKTEKRDRKEKAVYQENLREV